MKVREVIAKLELEVITATYPGKEVRGGYSGDLLSNVMAKAGKGDLWLTIQGHQNVVAVALLTGVAAVVVVENLEIEKEAIQKAEEKGVNLLRSKLSAYQLGGRLYQMGIR